MPRRKKKAEITPDNWEFEVAIAIKICCQSMTKVIQRMDSNDAALISAYGVAVKSLGELLITQQALTL